MKDLGDGYEGEIISAIIHAVLDARDDGTGQGGVIDPERTFRAMCMAVGIMAGQVDIFEGQKARREFADECRKNIFQAMVTASDPASGLNWMAAKPLKEH